MEGQVKQFQTHELKKLQPIEMRVSDRYFCVGSAIVLFWFVLSEATLCHGWQVVERNYNYTNAKC